MGLSRSLDRRGDGGMSVTALSAAPSGKRRFKNTMSETVASPDVSVPCTTVVFELCDVVVTQSAKLERKTAMFVAGATDIALTMLFGGEERLRMLNEWLSERARQTQ